MGRLLACAFVMTLVVGCGGDETTQQTSGTSGHEQTSTGTQGTGRHHGRRGSITGLGSDPAAAVDAARAALTGGPRDACRTSVTDRYVTTAYGGRAGCLAAQSAGGQAVSVKLRSAAIHGNDATAKLVPNGGPSSGETLTVSLIYDRQAARWRVDAVRSNAPVGP